jgi:MFS family permease
MPEPLPDLLRAPQGLRAIPRGIWALGLVSLFMDMSSELIHSLLPVFVVGTLGASALSLGLIEGVAEAAASITKLFSGVLSDRLGRRKLLAVVGYGLAALTKPLFPLAGSVELVATARFVDRIGKGIRGAPRDALVAEIAPAHLRGACYGLRQSLDTVGALVGPLLAVLFMALFAGDIRAVFWIAVVPAVLAVLLLVLGVEEPAGAHGTPGRARVPLRLADLARLPAACWWVIAIGGVLTLARFSEAFLVLRAQAAGLPPTLLPLVMAAMSLVYALSAYPAGVLADRLDRRGLLAAGLAVLILADLVLAAAGSVVLVMVGVGLWGLHMGLTQGLLATLVADTAPPDRRGSAFGLFNLVSGILLLAASTLAGGLWQSLGAAATFLAGAAFAGLALIGLLLQRHRGLV